MGVVEKILCTMSSWCWVFLSQRSIPIRMDPDWLNGNLDGDFSIVIESMFHNCLSSTCRLDWNFYSSQIPFAKVRLFPKDTIVEVLSEFLGVKRAYAYIDKQHRNKLDPKSHLCYFLGYCDNTNGYWLWDPLTSKVLLRREVVFNEQILFGTSFMLSSIFTSCVILSVVESPNHLLQWSGYSRLHSCMATLLKLFTWSNLKDLSTHIIPIMFVFFEKLFMGSYDLLASGITIFISFLSSLASKWVMLTHVLTIPFKVGKQSSS